MDKRVIRLHLKDPWEATVLWKDSPSPPPPPPAPDPTAQIRAQAAAIPSAYTPQGSRVFSGDPNTPGSFQYVESYSPSLQRQYDAKNALVEELLARGKAQLPKIPADPFKFTGNTQGVTDALFQKQKGLLDPEFAAQGRALDQKLANQGLPMGSEAYNEEMRRFEQNKNDAYTRAAQDAVAAGGAEESRQYGLASDERRQNLNELIGLLMGQQVQGGNFGGIPQIDTGSAFANQQAGNNLAYQGQMNAYNAGVGSDNQTMSTIGSIGSAALMFL